MPIPPLRSIPLRPSAARRAAPSLGVALAAVLCAACGSKGPPPPAPPPPVVQDVGRATVTVSSAQDGAQVRLKATQELQVELAIGNGPVTAGYGWLQTGGDARLLAPLGQRFERASRDVDAFESAGTSIVRFRAVGPGRTALEFALRQPHRRDAPLATVRFEVTVE